MKKVLIILEENVPCKQTPIMQRGVKKKKTTKKTTTG